MTTGDDVQAPAAAGRADRVLLLADGRIADRTTTLGAGARA